MNPGQGKRKGRKREKYTTEHVPLEFPSCLVCGKDSTGIHFGVYSCEACKVGIHGDKISYFSRENPSF